MGGVSAPEPAAPVLPRRSLRERLVLRPGLRPFPNGLLLMRRSTSLELSRNWRLFCGQILPQREALGRVLGRLVCRRTRADNYAAVAT